MQVIYDMIRYAGPPTRGVIKDMVLSAWQWR